jgi:site-specific DNA-cytosine methylase
MVTRLEDVVQNATVMSTDLRFIACTTFGSAFDLGAVQSGFKMVGKCERGNAFGASNALGNRHLLGDDWDLQIDEANDGTGWHPLDAELVIGNPPCSGFSLLTRADGFRGIHSPINSCMWAFVRYVARVKPQIAIFESVQQAYYQGIELMNALHKELEELTGETWYLTHVLHNNLSLGGCSLRRRYFWVASRVPFGVESIDLDYVPTADDALHDLEPLALTWNPQAYRHPPTRWSARLRSSQGLVDGHMNVPTPQWERARQVAENLGGWPQGASLEELCREHYKRFGCLPGDRNGITPTEIGFQYLVKDQEHADKVITREEHLHRRDFTMGATQLNRWRRNRHAYVITGGALTEYVHPCLLRTFTHREAARIQGFPDDWRIETARYDATLAAVWGKGVPVDAGRWITYWARESLFGRPGSLIGESRDGQERVVDITHTWKKFLSETWREYQNRTRSGTGSDSIVVEPSIVERLIGSVYHSSHRVAV